MTPARVLWRRLFFLTPAGVTAPGYSIRVSVFLILHWTPLPLTCFAPHEFIRHSPHRSQRDRGPPPRLPLRSLPGARPASRRRRSGDPHFSSGGEGDSGRGGERPEPGLPGRAITCAGSLPG